MTVVQDDCEDVTAVRSVTSSVVYRLGGASTFGCNMNTHMPGFPNKYRQSKNKMESRTGQHHVVGFRTCRSVQLKTHTHTHMPGALNEHWQHTQNAEFRTRKCHNQSSWVSQTNEKSHRHMGHRHKETHNKQSCLVSQTKTGRQQNTC